MSDDYQKQIDEYNKKFEGKSLAEIIEISKSERRADGSMLKKNISDHRTNMLTVQKLIDYLKTCNPNACVLAYENNSFAYIEQMPDLPNDCVCTVAIDKKKEKEYLEHWYKDTDDKDKKIRDDIDEMYRYANDDDVIIKF